MAAKRSIKHLPFQFYGSKWGIDEWLVGHPPRDNGEKTLVITHGGGGSPLWRVNPPFEVEVLNDLNSDITHFFRVVRDRPSELALKLLFTPYHHGEWAEAAKQYKDGTLCELDELEHARRFAVVMRQSCSFAVGETWSRVLGHCRRGMASGNSRWLNVPESVLDAAKRLASVQLESRPALELIDDYDSPKTVFYVDPPYPECVANCKPYRHQMTDADHVELCRRLRETKGAVVLSSYRNPIYDRELPDWEVRETRVTCRSSVSTTGSVSPDPTRVEAVYKKRARHG